jgi:4-hydroxy-4-methyl-2-oxoglutarate aldolase
VGDNTATYIREVTHRGMVVDGAIRDLEGIFPIPMGAYYRGVHPTPISKELMITGINVPIRICNAAVLPGDVVFGDREGVYFVPPHRVTKVLDKADELHVHDEWTRDKFINENKKYKSSEIYGAPKDPAPQKEYRDYLKKRLVEVHAKEGPNQ